MNKCCVAAVYKRDCYRRTRRGSSGFSMHYTKEQCSRRAVYDGRCWQHRDKNRYWQEADFYHTVVTKLEAPT